MPPIVEHSRLSHPDSTARADGARSGRRETTGPVIDCRTLARELLSARDPRLRALYRRRPGRSTLALLRCWGAIAGAIALVAWSPTPGILSLAFVVIGTQQYALTVLSHEAKHRNLYESAKINDWVGLWLTAAPLGASFLSERRRHLAHHSRLGREDDPDRDLYRAADKSRIGDLLLYLSSLTTLPGLGRTSSDEDSFRTTRSRILRVVGERWQAIPFQLALLAVFVVVGPWWLYPLLWLAPLGALMLVPARIRQFCEHAHPLLPDKVADDRRLVTYRPNPVERLLLAPFHMGYHAEHHLWPGVPCWNLPALAGLVPDDPRIERRDGYVSFIVSYLRSLPLAPGAVADR